MQRRILLSLLLAFTSAWLNAALPPDRKASFFDHLREVNAQWDAHERAASLPARSIAFADEPDRIRMHLRAVIDVLSITTPEGISAQAMEQRIDLLQRLSTYADARSFPQNHVLPYRNPIFIDPYGTACAVGWLMIESGHADLANAIAAATNQAYLAEIAQGPFADRVSAWEHDHGFTGDELAWIQPGYPPTHPWAPVGEGTNGPVNELLYLANGDLVAAGDFTMAGGMPIHNIATWDGAMYSALGDGLAGEIRTVIEFGNEIIVGGVGLGGGVADLARWNGTGWTYQTIFEGKLPAINALHVHNNELFAAGEAMGFAGIDHGVRKVNSNGTYEMIGSYLDGRVLDLKTYMGFLVAAGEFTGVAYATDPLIAHVAILEGNEWSQLANGTDAPVRAMLVEGTNLYLGGDLFVQQVPTFGLARLSNMQPVIEELLPSHETYMDPQLEPNAIRALTMVGDELYVSGRFFIGGMIGAYGNNVAKFVEQYNVIEPMISTEGDVNTMASLANKLVIGGEFQLQFPHIAMLDITTAIEDPGSLSIGVSPNPVHDMLTIDMEISSNATIEVIDASGKEVIARATRNSDRIQLDVKDLSTGTYLVKITAEGTIHSARFVKE